MSQITKSAPKENVSPIKLLEDIDWNFNNEKTNLLTHDFHPYPAKFIPQIPRNLIEIFTKEHETVYDPFCGCGTTVVEAISRNRNAIGNDLNPLAVLISKVKATNLSVGQINILKKAVERIRIKIDELYNNKNSLKRREITGSTHLNIPNLQGWFDEHVINELAIIKNGLASLRQEVLQDFLKVAFSSIIVTVSLQDSDTRYVRSEKKIAEKETFKKFENKILRMLNKMESFTDINSLPKLLVGDTRCRLPFESNSADVAITSPPYPNAYDYHLYHRYRMFWLNMDPRALKRSEIGSHANYSKTNGHTEQNFHDDMTKCFIEVSRILKKDKYFCIVIGDSILKGRKIKNNELLKRVASETPFKYIHEIKRTIQLSKKSFNPAIGNIKQERIMIFKNSKTSQ